MIKQMTVFAAFLLGGAVCATAAGYKVQARFSIPDSDGWDYITVDSDARRIYVSHSVRVNVLNEDTGALIGTIEDPPIVHGIAIASKQNHGFTSNDKEDKVTMFNLSTLAVIKKTDVGEGPDGIYFDAETGRAFTNNHHSHEITAIDATTGTVAVTLPVGGDGEGAATGKDGLMYVALEDKNEIAVFNPKTLEVARHFQVDDLKGPSGMAVDAKSNHVFVGGHNKTMLVLDGDTGKNIASLPTGSGTDAAGSDGHNKRIFFSNGEGNPTVIQESPRSQFTRTPVASHCERYGEVTDGRPSRCAESRIPRAN